jgi:hypothetical protein
LSDIDAQYGQLLEIRLIIQPIIKNPEGSPKVLDIAGHLIFDFVILPPPAAPSDCFPRFQPDMSAFRLYAMTQFAEHIAQDVLLGILADALERTAAVNE